MRSWNSDELDAAGERLRQAWIGMRMMEVQYQDDRDLLNRYRRDGRTALNKAAMGLRSSSSTLGLDALDITQRTKQWTTTIEKLNRMKDRNPPLRLSEMVDVLGCRIVLPDPGSVERLYEHLRRRAADEIKEVRDYRQKTRGSGYRALHLHTIHHGRLVEIQIRTQRQQQWAEISESLQSPIGGILRDGKGPKPIRDYLKALGVVFSALDQQIEPTEAQLNRLRAAHHGFEEYRSHHERG